MLRNIEHRAQNALNQAKNRVANIGAVTKEGDDGRFHTVTHWETVGWRLRNLRPKNKNIIHRAERIGLQAKEKLDQKIEVAKGQVQSKALVTARKVLENTANNPRAQELALKGAEALVKRIDVELANPQKRDQLAQVVLNKLTEQPQLASQVQETISHATESVLKEVTRPIDPTKTQPEPPTASRLLLEQMLKQPIIDGARKFAQDPQNAQNTENLVRNETRKLWDAILNGKTGPNTPLKSFAKDRILWPFLDETKNYFLVFAKEKLSQAWNWLKSKVNSFLLQPTPQP